MRRIIRILTLAALLIFAIPNAYATDLWWVGANNAMWQDGGGNWENALNSPQNFTNNTDSVYFNKDVTRNVRLIGELKPNLIDIGYSSNYTFFGSGKITGGNLTINDNASLFLDTSANTFASVTIDDGASLTAREANMLGNCDISNAGTLNLDFMGGGTLTNVITGAGNINKGGFGNLTLTGNSENATGKLTVSSGNITIEDGGNYGGEIASNNTVNFYRTGDWTYNGTLSGRATLNIGNDTAKGTVTLAKDNSNFTGDVNVNSDSGVVFGADNASGSGTTYVKSDAVVNLNAHSSDSAFELSGGTLINSIADTTSTVRGNILIGTGGINQIGGEGDLTISGFIDENYDLVGFEKTGTGTLTLMENNNYSGGTTISAGTLKLSEDGTLGSGSVEINTDTDPDAKLSIDRDMTLTNVITGKGKVEILQNVTLTADNSIPAFTGGPSFTGTTTIEENAILTATHVEASAAAR